MHRHGYKGRKLGRTRDPRRLLIKNLATELFNNQSVTTTLAKAKEVISYSERLITKAKKGDLHNRRQIISKLTTIDSAHKLVDHISPQLTQRPGGYLKLITLSPRKGDGAQMAYISFNDNLEADFQKSQAVASSKSSPAKANKQKLTSQIKAEMTNTSKPAPKTNSQPQKKSSQTASRKNNSLRKTAK
ncbi:MAG: 50S ribosomal protein L17 [Candidatus Saccharibacteria bacterium]|nr:50S ribosomal protein L17 [Candidatus Saccharibacteria bacterium]